MTSSDAAVLDFQHGGALSQHIAGYAERSSQIEMASLVAHALANEEHAVIEAPTGTGKGYAYLIPAVRSGKVVVVSTATINLQEQLCQKDIPVLQQAVQPFTAEKLKGMSNYLCHARLHDLEPHSALKRRMLPMLATWDGDFESSSAPQLSDSEREEIKAEHESCIGRECMYYAQCPVMQARQRVAGAQVVIVNHHLLLFDAAFSGNILPSHALTVVDEAHHLEAVATDVFTVSVSRSRLHSLLIQKRLKHIDAQDRMELDGLNNKVWSRLAAQLGKTDRIVLDSPNSEGMRLADEVATFVKKIQNKRPRTTDTHEQAMYAKLLWRAERLRNDMESAFSGGTQKSVCFLEKSVLSSGTAYYEAKNVPLYTAPFLHSSFFLRGPVVCTSATLSTSRSLDYYIQQVGLALGTRTVQKAILKPVFDYRKQALLYLTDTMPEPTFDDQQGRDVYEQALADEMLRLVEASAGRAFLLFSSRRALESVHKRIAYRMHHLVLKQGDMSKQALLEAFKQSGNAVLFGLKSFWEGVDVQGEALSLVVIDKLPFSPPDDPLMQARIARMQGNGNWFRSLMLPQAILLLKQGVGRLIRTSQDRGVMAVLDPRILTRSYGTKDVLPSLPLASTTNMFSDVVAFFNGTYVVEDDY